MKKAAIAAYDADFCLLSGWVMISVEYFKALLMSPATSKCRSLACFGKKGLFGVLTLFSASVKKDLFALAILSPPFRPDRLRYYYNILGLDY